MFPVVYLIESVKIWIWKPIYHYQEPRKMFPVAYLIDSGNCWIWKHIYYLQEPCKMFPVAYLIDSGNIWIWKIQLARPAYNVPCGEFILSGKIGIWKTIYHLQEPRTLLRVTNLMIKTHISESSWSTGNLQQIRNEKNKKSHRVKHWGSLKKRVRGTMFPLTYLQRLGEHWGSIIHISKKVYNVPRWLLLMNWGTFHACGTR